MQRLVEQPFSTLEEVLLCCFGLELTAERTHDQLRRALLAAGFSGPVVRHLIRASPLLRRGARGSYRLQKFGD